MIINFIIIIILSLTKLINNHDPCGLKDDGDNVVIDTEYSIYDVVLVKWLGGVGAG